MNRRMPRRDKVLYAVDRAGKGLEIGPSFNPLAPKREGFNVEIVDHLDQAGLVEKYRALGCSTDAIEPVDYVWRGENYAALTGKPHHYDWIIASHVIEHAPDLIGFLNSCEGVLAENGALSLVVPDQRYCFDLFRPFSGLGSVVDAHLNDSIRPGPGIAAECEMYMASRGGAITWDRLSDEAFALMHAGDAGRKAFEHLRSSKDYADYHVWCFTPSSFRLLIHDLRTLGLIELQEAAFFATKGCEFFVTLKRSAGLQAVDRLELLQSIQRELREQPSVWERWRHRVRRRKKAARGR